MHRKLTVFKGEVLLQLVEVVLVKPKNNVLHERSKPRIPVSRSYSTSLPVCDEVLVGDGGSTDGTLRT